MSGSNVVGQFKDAGGVTHGFLYNGSTFTPLDPAGSTFTAATAVSGSNVVGQYKDSGGVTHGFFYDGSTFTTLDPAGSTFTAATAVSGSNVVGQYTDAGAVTHGFFYNGSTFATLDPAGSTFTSASALSGSNVVGQYKDASGNTHGFLYNGSTFVSLDVPGAKLTQANGISGSNVVGLYQDAGNKIHGFLYNGSTYASIDPPGDKSSQADGISGSNVAGQYQDASNKIHGFLYQIAPVVTDFVPSVDWGGTVVGAPTVSVQLVSQTASSSTWKVVGNAVYAEPGNFTAVVTVQDATGSSVQTNKTSFAVSDGVLTDTTPTTTVSGSEGQANTSVVLATFTDANPLATAGDYSISSLNWGGTLVGTPVLSFVVDGSFSGSGSGWKVVADSVTYPEAGLHTVSLTVHDVDGNNVSTSNTQFQIADVPITDTTPTATVNGTEGTANTNVVLATFTDANAFASAGDYSVSSQNFGGTLAGTAPTLSIVADGSYSGPGSGWKVVANTVTYAEKGTYTVSLTISDVGGSSLSTNHTSFNMADAALTDTTPTATVSATEGQANTNVTLMTFTDADRYSSAGDFSIVSPAWGGTLAGTLPTLSIVADGSYSGPGSGWKVMADTVTYAQSGTFAVSLTVHDVFGQNVSTSNTSFDMADAALTDTTPVTTINATGDLPRTNVTLMTFTDANPYATAGDFNVNSENFGDTLVGTPPTLSVVADASYSGPGSGWKVVADTVTYADLGTYTVSLSVHDVGGNNVSTNKTSFGVAQAGLVDTTPVSTTSEIEGISTGNVVLATFSSPIPAAGLIAGLSVPGATSTTATAVAGGTIVGSYVDGGGNTHGFVFTGSTYATIDPPGSTFTSASGISGNNVVGDYQDAGGNSHGFLYNGTTYATIDPPGSTLTTIAGVSGGNVVGSFGDVSGKTHGFLYNGTTYTTIDPPGSTFTSVTGVSGSNVVGQYQDAGFVDHGFVFNGTTYTTIDPPGSTLTSVLGVSGNNVVGEYRGAGGVTHGFLYNGTSYATIDPPGSTDTSVLGVSGGDMVGTYVVSGVTHGFLYDGTTYTTIDPSGATSTTAAGISGSNVVGSYVDGSGHTFGFLYQLAPVQSDFTPNVNWGGTLDGTPTVSVQLVSHSASGSIWNVVGNAIYAEPGTYTAVVTVSDASGNSVGTNKTSFNVADAALTDTTPVATIDGTEGVALTNVTLMTFTDANPYAEADDFSVTSHNYGGTLAGTAPTLSIVVDGSYSGSGTGWKVVADTLTYRTTGTYTVALTVHDAGGNNVSTTGTSFNMADAALTDTTPVATVSGTEGVAQTNVTLMTFTDANPFAPAADFSVTSQNFGGTLAGTAPTLSIVVDSSYSGSGSGWKVVADTLTYRTTGTYTVALTVHDAGGNNVSTTGTRFSMADAALTDTTPMATIGGTEGVAQTNVADDVHRRRSVRRCGGLQHQQPELRGYAGGNGPHVERGGRRFVLGFGDGLESRGRHADVPHDGNIHRGVDGA